MIGIITHYLAKFSHLISSFFSTLIIILGIGSAGILFCIFTLKIPQELNNNLYEKMGSPEYQVHVLPKNNIWSKDVSVCFKNNDTKARIELTIESNLEADEIYAKIKDLQPHLNKVLKSP